MTDKDPDAYRTISEVADALNIPPHVLRFWETKFPQIKPLKRGGGRRFYRRPDIDLLHLIRRRLYEDGYTIRGVQRLLRSKGCAGLAADPTPTERFSAEEAVVIAATSGPDTTTTRAPTRMLLEQIATEIAACQAVLSAALRASEPPTARH